MDITPEILIDGAILAAFASYMYCYWRGKATRDEIINFLPRRIYSKTMEAVEAEGKNGRLNKDGLWTLANEKDLVRQYGHRWIAVVDEQVLATADTAEAAWDRAIAKAPSKKPFVRRFLDSSPTSKDVGND
ncbi:MAG: hypothetical protein UY62_C0091G0002 [Parcubacteria group bacterium GW2011_GWF2_50_9]|nr:MAG: hypothetical protein UY62_C0091G0002 [Parcubacteria group bacterium GW2011_GWF2_50_9]